MKLKFYVLHCDSNLYNCFLITKDNGVTSYLIGKRTSKILHENKRVYQINSYGFHIFLNELKCSPTYHRAVAKNVKSTSSPFVIQLIPNRLEFIDKTWWVFFEIFRLFIIILFNFRGEIVRVLIWELLEIDHMMSWLSTLGGAFSALGDYFEDRARIAGKISVAQMKLALRLGDPGLISRCLLYFSIALIQKQQFRTAQHIIRTQFVFASQVDDTRLKKMCMGIWSKLQYQHKITRINRKAVKQG